MPLHRIHPDDQAGGHRGREGCRCRQADHEVQPVQLHPLRLEAVARHSQALTHLVFSGEVAQCLQVGEPIAQMRVGLEAGRRDGMRTRGQPPRASREDDEVDERGDAESDHQGRLAQVDENPGHRHELDNHGKHAPGQVSGGQLGACAPEIEAVLQFATSTSGQVARRQAQDMIEEAKCQAAMDALVDRARQERLDIRQRTAGEQHEQIPEGIAEQGARCAGRREFLRFIERVDECLQDQGRERDGRTAGDHDQDRRRPAPHHVGICFGTKQAHDLQHFLIPRFERRHFAFPRRHSMSCHRDSLKPGLDRDALMDLCRIASQRGNPASQCGLHLVSIEEASLNQLSVEKQCPGECEIPPQDRRRVLVHATLGLAGRDLARDVAGERPSQKGAAPSALREQPSGCRQAELGDRL